MPIPDFPRLHVTTPDELPRTLIEHGRRIRKEADRSLGRAIVRDIANRALWLQTNGPLYCLRQFGDTDARLEFYNGFLPVEYNGLRKLTSVDTEVSPGVVTSSGVPGSPLCAFALRYEASGNSAFTDSAIADYHEVAVSANQPITLLEEDDYFDTLRSPDLYTGPVLVTGHTAK